MRIHCPLNEKQAEVVRGMSTVLKKNTTLNWTPIWNICVLDFYAGVLIFNETARDGSALDIEVPFEKLLEAVKHYGNLPLSLNYSYYSVKKSGSGFGESSVGKSYGIIAYNSRGYGGNPGVLLADYTNKMCSGYVGLNSFFPEGLTSAEPEKTTSVSFLAYKTDSSGPPTALIKLFDYIESRDGDTSFFNGYKGLLNQNNEVFYFDSGGVFSCVTGHCSAIEIRKPQPYVPSALLSFEDFMQKALIFGYVKNSFTRAIIRQYLKSLAESEKENIVAKTEVEYSPSLSPTFDVAMPAVEQKGYVISKDLHVSVNFQKKQKKNFIIY